MDFKKITEQAWKIYCKDTAGSMDVRDYWEDLPPRVQLIFLDKAVMANEWRNFFKDIRWAVGGMAASSLLNTFAINVYMGIATITGGTAFILFLRLLVNRWKYQSELSFVRMYQELEEAKQRKNEYARELGWPTT